MNRYIQLCISLIACTSLCHGASTFATGDTNKLNRALVQLPLQPVRTEQYTYRDEYEHAKSDVHPTSNLKISSTHYERTSTVWVLDATKDRKVLWEHAFTIDWQTTPIRATWYDATGELIALRGQSRGPYQWIYRVSYMSLLQKLKPEQQELLRDALWLHHKHNTPLTIHDDSIGTEYSSLPQELKLPVLFSPVLRVRVREIVRTILCCGRTR